MMKWLLAFIQKHFKPASAEIPKAEEKIMSEPLNDEVVEPQPAINQEVSNSDAVLAKLKELVAAAGAQAHAVFDDLVELAKKLV